MKNLWLFCLLLFASNVIAQKTVTGNITSSSDGGPLPGVNILIKGTATGTVTDFDGNYSIDVPDNNVTLVYSFIGFTAQEIVVGDQTVINVALSDDSELVGEVVVTALGIKREKKALGYSVAEVGDEAFESAKSANPMSALSGRLSGVQVSSTAQGPAGSASVIIRGNAIADGNNQPLYVVDGVPISNNQYSNADDGDNGGIDSGNGLSGIAADDIENISVLKGAAATALYGSRAINGVVMITTKSGKGAQGTTIDFTSSTTIEQARIYTDWQDKYGQGTFGNAPTNQQESKDNTSMWGAPYSAVNSYTDYAGRTRPYQFYDNENNFYESGVTYSNNVSISNNTEFSTLRMSYSNLTNDGIVPGTDYDRNTFTINGNAKAWDGKLDISAKLSYINENSTNVAIGGTVFGSSLIGTPNNVSLSDLKEYKDENGNPIGFGNRNSNVYWNLFEVNNTYTKERIMTMGQAKYNLTDDLSIQARYGNDKVVFSNQSIFPINTPYYEAGRATSGRSVDSETNIDGMLTYTKELDTWGITVNAGGAFMQREFDALYAFDEQFADQALQRPGFGQVRQHTVEYSRRQIHSVFATGQFHLGSYFYVDLSARNDWSSTLPLANNSYFYPSVSSSLIFTELFDQPAWFSFGKLRASWAQVGSDTDPYQLKLIYSPDPIKHPGSGGNSSNASIDGTTIPNNNLKPSLNKSYEIGLDLKFFNNRLGVDVAYYNSKAVNQIVRVATSNTSGFENAIFNAGSIRNAGVELSIYAEPVRTENFSWTTTLNYAYNQNDVLSLTEGVNQLTLFNNGGVSIVAKPGEEYGKIMGTKYKREDDGSIALDANGRPTVTDELHELGTAYHKSMLGWVNRFAYKNFSATLVLDGKFGGSMYSATEAGSYSNGKHKATLQRDGYDGSEWFPKELEGKGTTSTPQELFGSIASIDEQFVYDASFVALQEINLTYSVPASVFENNKFIKAASAGVFVRNLGYLYRETDNIDPQAAFSITNGGAGVERNNLAVPRSYGLNLNFKF